MKRIYNLMPVRPCCRWKCCRRYSPSCWTCRAAVCRFGMSHRAPIYEKINAEAEADIKELLGLGDDYCVLFMGGGASLQFSMVPMNFWGLDKRRLMP